MHFVAWIVLCAIGTATAAAQPQKNYEDREEFDVYDEVTKDFRANNFSKALTDLEHWSEKYPDSDFKDDRQVLYVQAYAGATQAAKVLDAAGGVLANDRFASANPATVIRVLYDVVSAIQRVPDPSPQQIATAAKAAGLLDSYDTPPEGATAPAWAATRADLRSAAQAALLYIAILPASRAMKANDCSGAEAAAMKAIEQFPESVQAAWLLALANICLAKSDPAKSSLALYELARASSLDPVKGMADGKWQQATVLPYMEKSYTQFHGADPRGLKELKELAQQSPLPPAGFVIKSVAEIEGEQEAKLEIEHPELALWMKIRQALSGIDGEHYFESELKGVSIPELQGVLVEARPACRPTELRVAIRLPSDARNPRENVALKLEKPLIGKPEIGSELHWTGVAAAFSKEPFLLTMDVEPFNVKKLTVSPCQPMPRRKLT